MDTTTPHSLEPQPTASALPSAPLNTTHHNLETPPRTIYSDRFIPSRSSSNFALFNLSPHPCNSYNTLLGAALFGPDSFTLLPLLTPEKLAHNNYRYLQCSPPNSNIFKFKTETKRSLHSLSPFAFDDQLPGICPAPVKAPRKVPRSPYKILHAPGLQDNFYLNLVDWSSQNVLAVGLGNCVYLWHASISKVVKLCDLRIDDSLCSVGWAQRGSHLAVGTRNGKLQLFVWNQHSTQPVLKYHGHTATVKAIAWSPQVHGLLASGGGIADRCIRFWNTTTDSHLSCIATGSQVCNLVWSKNVDELVSTHGYSQNQIIVWKYPPMSMVINNSLEVSSNVNVWQLSRVTHVEYFTLPCHQMDGQLSLEQEMRHLDSGMCSLLNHRTWRVTLEHHLLEECRYGDHCVLVKDCYLSRVLRLK